MPGKYAVLEQNSVLARCAEILAQVDVKIIEEQIYHREWGEKIERLSAGLPQ